VKQAQCFLETSCSILVFYNQLPKKQLIDTGKLLEKVLFNHLKMERSQVKIKEKKLSIIVITSSSEKCIVINQ